MIQKQWSVLCHLGSNIFSNYIHLIPRTIIFLANLLIWSLINIKALVSTFVQCLYCLDNVYCESIDVPCLIPNATKIKLTMSSPTVSVSTSRKLFIQAIREVSCSLAGQVSANSLCNNMLATANGEIWIKHIDFALVSLVPPPFPWHVCWYICNVRNGSECRALIRHGNWSIK